MVDISNFIFYFFISHYNCSVGVAMGYGLDGRGSISGRVKVFLFSTASRPALGPTRSRIQRIPGTFFPGVKRPGREANHSPPTNTEVKNGGAILPLPHISSRRTA
jgi:hypothetical protein